MGTLNTPMTGRMFTCEQPTCYCRMLFITERDYLYIETLPPNKVYKTLHFKWTRDKEPSIDSWKEIT